MDLHARDKVGQKSFGDRTSPVMSFIILGTSVFVVELILMLLEPLFSFVRQEFFLVDAFLLTVCLLPVFYVFLYRPMVQIITKRKIAEVVLRERQEFLNMIVVNSSDIIVILDVNGVIRYITPAVKRVLGYRPEDLIGKSLTTFVHPDDYDAALAIRSCPRHVGPTPMQELRVCHCNGSWRYIEVVANNLLDSPEICGIIINMRDVTQRLQDEVALRESEKRYSSLFRNNHAVMLLIDPHTGEIVDANAAAINFYGYSRADLLSLKISHLNRLPEVDIFTRMNQSVMDECHHFEFQHRLADGSIRDVEVYTGYLQMHQRELLYSIIHDITARQTALEELRKLSSAIEQSPSSVVITDVNGDVEYVNPKFVEVTGYTFEEVKGLNTRIFKSGDKTAEEYRELWQTISSGQKWTGEFHNRKKNGELYWEAASISPARNSKGVITSYIAVKEDITEQKLAAEKIRYLAYHDGLTGLANRMLFEDRLNVALAAAQRTQRIVAVMFLDIDGFKRINDNYGHSTGDQLLKEVATRLNGIVRAHDTVARMGGDEFTILYTGLQHQKDVERLAQKVLEAFQLPYMCGDYALRVTTSIGLASFPASGDNFDVLMRVADTAMYYAKEHGKNNYHFGSPNIETAIHP
ncbi:MAG: PAS domain S-box protein [Peptococcaceae bacterium]|nr:PAS domain S-box protein [Peptococcaceae bacterium]